ncbi:Ig-like domain-containing protein [Plantibacter sp. Mn2098]|uniref:Ig-like domain-containing protein n=1 Tax=Plantibacter sp. Mn2098 TaxID=3395266 RepID=UPI003BC54831
MAAVVFVTDGYTEQRVDLDDASAWVVNGSKRLVGHANTRLEQLSTVVDIAGGDVELLQTGDRLLAHDRAANTIEVIDPAGATVTDTVPLPVGVPVVESAGNRVAVTMPETGDVWVVDLADIATFDAASPATLNVGADAVFALDQDGGYAGFSRRSGRVTTGSVLSGEDGHTVSVSFSGDVDHPAVSVVNGHPVVLNPASSEVWIDGTTVDLVGQADEPESLRIGASDTQSTRVLVSGDEGLFALPVDGGSPARISAGGTGTAAAPVTVDGCTYAAWSDGTAVVACDGGRPRSYALDGVVPGGILDIVVNTRTIVANDPSSGRTWDLRADGAVIDNWGDFDVDADVVDVEQDERDVPPDVEQEQLPPVAADDELGARPGRPTVLPVLVNDSDPNGDPLVISGVEEIPATLGRVDIVNNAQQLLVTTRPEASGSIVFGYTIDDGHGLHDQATVTLAIRGPNENSPPAQVRPTRGSVAVAGSASIQTLVDWVDPDGDPIFLQDASVQEPARTTFTADGALELRSSGGAGGVATASIVVSDGTAAGDGTVQVTIGEPGAVPLIAESFAITGYTGQEVSVAPTSNARGGTGPITVSGVSAVQDDEVRIDADYSRGTAVIRADTAGTHLLEYAVTDGSQTTSARIRFETTAPPGGVSTPVVRPVTVFLPLHGTVTARVLDTAFDPAGGVLDLVGVGAAPEASGVLLESIDQRDVRVTLKRQLDDGPVTVPFTVTNGQTTADGQLTIVMVPDPSKLQPPVALADTISVRVGAVVDVPVLENDSQPDGKPFLLDPDLVEDVPDGGGVLVSATDRLRYLAPSKPGTYRAVYRISTADGQWATAPVTITVRDLEAADNTAPDPLTITARVTSGGTVSIPVPLGGIDDDGDTVTLLGATDSPRLGAITGTGRSMLEYEAGPYSTGTDTFQYAVVDALGAVGTGTVRIGVSPPAEQVAQPVAVDDLVVTRPGATLTVPVLENDSDPDGGRLTITAVEPTDDTIEVRFTADAVTLDAPDARGGYGVLYTIQNPRGGTSQAWLYIDVDPDAPPARPTAHDVVLSFQDFGDRESIDVDVLASARSIEGGKRDLVVSVPGDALGVDVDADGKVRVPIVERSRIIPFTVARADAPDVESTAFIWMPGTADAAPERRQAAPGLTVASGDTLTIPIGQQMVAAGGRPVLITDTASATGGDGSPLVADETTLAFTSAAGFWGPASVTVGVTDASDGRGNRSTITLPITVTPSETQPPVVRGVAVSLESGASTTIDLLSLTEYPYPKRRSKLTFTAESGSKAIVGATVSGSVLTIRAVDGAAVGSSAKVVVQAADGGTTSTSGVISIDVVRSTRPIVSPQPDRVVVTRGSTVPVDVLANDEATNPFPGHPLTVAAIDTRGLPVGVSVASGADRSRLSVTVDRTGPTGDFTVPYEVADVTGDAARNAIGTVVIRVQDVPDAPGGAPRVVSQDNEAASVVLAVPHAFPNASEITGYRVSSADGSVSTVCTDPDRCAISGLVFGQPYSFSATATNGVGEGAPSPQSAPVVVDTTPGASASVRVTGSNQDQDGHAVTVEWDAVASKTGTPVAAYEVALTGPGGVELGTTVPTPNTSTTFQNPSIAPGQQYTAAVVAKNRTNQGQAAAGSGVAVGPPTVGNVKASLVSGTAGAVWVDVDWDGASAGGGSSLRFAVSQASGGDPGAMCDPATFRSNVPSGTSWRDTRPADGGAYLVAASNGLFCRQVVSGPVQLQPVLSGGRATLSDGTSGTVDLVVESLSSAASDLHHYEAAVVASGAGPSGWVTVNSGASIGGGADYGRVLDVWARACGLASSQSCGAPVRIGQALVPLRVRASVLSCPVDGRQTIVNAPDNNGLSGVVEVSYLTLSATGAVEARTPWGPPSAAPAPPGGRTTTVLTRVQLAGIWYAPPLDTATTCR